MIPKLEYKIVETMLYLGETELNELGIEGWYLSTVMNREEPVRYVFVRPLGVQL